MTSPEARATAGKSGLHPRNRHRNRYDFDQLIQASPELARFVKLNAYHDASIDFADPAAVKALNRALLQQAYGISDWDIPARYLCPPIPGRADYLHHAADLLAATHGDRVPRGDRIRVLDVGVGANAVYPLIGHREYGWHFVGSDIDPVAIANAQAILEANAGLGAAIELRVQSSPSALFDGIVRPDERFDLTLCNPPFHASIEAARAGTQRKWRNLGRSAAPERAPRLNFGGQGAELCCAGGEAGFVGRMVAESAHYGRRTLWFTTLISSAANLPGVYRAIQHAGAQQTRTVDMAQGQKKSRFVAWTFLDAQQHAAWARDRWLRVDAK